MAEPLLGNDPATLRTWADTAKKSRGQLSSRMAAVRARARSADLWRGRDGDVFRSSVWGRIESLYASADEVLGRHVAALDANAQEQIQTSQSGVGG